MKNSGWMPKVVLTLINDLAYDRRILRIISALEELNYQITVINVCKTEAVRTSEEYSFTYIPIVTRYKNGVFFYAEVAYRIHSILRNLTFDVLYSVDYDTLLPGLFVNPQKWVFDSHELFHEVPELEQQGIKKTIWQKMASFCLQKTTLNLTVSQSLADYISNLYGQPFEVVRNFPELKDDSVSNNFSSSIIIYQGALNTGRGLELLIYAMVELPAFHLVLLGDGDISPDLKKLVNQLQLDERISFKGKVDPSELGEWTKKAFLGYNLLDDVSLSYYYSLANKFSDYFHAGIPSLNSEFPEYEYFCTNYHVGLCIPFTVDDIVNTILKLKADESLYQSFHESCLEARKELNWQNEKKHFQALIQNLEFS